MEQRETQRSNALSPICVKLAGISTEDKFLQPENALLLILETP